MPIEQKILAGNCEITTGAFTPTTAMPTFQGENNAVRMEITFFDDGVAYNIPSGVDVRAHLYYAARPAMTQSLQMEVVGNLATLDVSDLFTAVSGTPLMVVRLVDSSGDIQVSCAFGVNVKPTLSGTVIYLLPPSPDEIIYVGRSPYVGNNGNWWTFDNDLHVFVDSGYASTGNYYVFAKWSASAPTQDSDMQDTPADWIGWYTGPAMTAPAHYTDYVWFLQKGATGATGASGTNGADGDDGVGIVSVAKTSTTGLVDTYTITYTDATTSTFTVTNGADGADGADGANGTNGTSAYVHIKWSAVNPTQNSDMTDTPSAYIGIYSGTSATAPTAYTSYAWYQYKGADGDPGSPGAGLPTGGAVNQIPVKSSTTDYATAWGNAILQYAAMPTAAAGLAGQIAQFTGATGTYTNGYTYICQSDGGAGYEWAEHATGDYATSAQGIPTGGTAGQALIKSGTPNFVTEWAAVGRTNKNLLHNWDFRFSPVNQRRASGDITTSVYFYDRWLRNAGTITIASTYLSLPASAAIEQRIEGNALAGITVTVSVMVGGAVISGTGTFPSSAGTSPSAVNLTGFGTFTLDYVAGYMKLVLTATSSTRQLQAVKLELGAYSTLAYDAPADFGEQLALCKRYYVVSSTDTGANAIGADVIIPMNAEWAPVTSSFPVQMRIAPTVTILACSKWYTSNVPMSGVTADSVSANKISALNGAGGFTANVSMYFKYTASADL